MDKENFILLVIYDTYGNDREDIANLCDAANKIALATSREPLCEGSLSDFVETIDDMIAKNEISVGEYGLDVEKTVSIDELTNRELHFIDKVRPTDIQDAIE